MSRIYVEKNIPLIYIEGITEAKDSDTLLPKGRLLKSYPKVVNMGRWCQLLVGAKMTGMWRVPVPLSETFQLRREKQHLCLSYFASTTLYTNERMLSLKVYELPLLFIQNPKKLLRKSKGMGDLMQLQASHESQRNEKTILTSRRLSLRTQVSLHHVQGNLSSCHEPLDAVSRSPGKKDCWVGGHMLRAIYFQVSF